MYSFKCDYSEGAHEKIITALINGNREQMDGYGDDPHTQAAVRHIKEKVGREDVGVYLLPTGTLTNLTAISAMLRPHESVISAETGHINVHETGAIEATGHKVITVETVDGRLRPTDIATILVSHGGYHTVKPKVVFITNSTETGTVYRKKELTDLFEYCKSQNMYLYIDGARLGAALMSLNNDLSLPEIARLCDAFYISAAKNGGFIGEALIICNPNVNVDFKHTIKQRGGMCTKGRLLGIQFEELFKDNLYNELALHANKMAKKIADALSVTGVEFAWKPETNQIFPIFNDEKVKQLEKEFAFYTWKSIDDKTAAIRLITSWATEESKVDRFIALATCQ